MKISGVSLALGLILSACSAPPENASHINTAGIKTMAVQPQSPTAVSVWDGTIEAVQQATLTAQTAGRVSAVLVDVNDRVSVNSLLIQLSAVEQHAGADTALAQLAAAKAQAIEAENGYRRYADLAAKQYISKQQLDQALAARNTARAQVLAAQAQVTQAGQQSNYTRIRAPFAGIVADRLVEPGESVSIGQPMLSVFNPDRLRVEVQVPQGIAEWISKNPKAVIQFDDHSRVEAKQVQVFPSADANAHSVKVRVLLPSSDKALKPGQVAKIVFDVPGDRHNRFIPRSAVWQRGELSAVYVVTEKAILLRQVRLGEARGDMIEIISGLAGDERIAVNPAQAADALVAYKAKAARHD